MISDRQSDKIFLHLNIFENTSHMARSISGFSDTYRCSFWFRPTHAVTTRQMSEVCEACSGLTSSATELCDVIHGRHKSMALSGR